jgi:hypothetical protein
MVKTKIARAIALASTAMLSAAVFAQSTGQAAFTEAVSDVTADIGVYGAALVGVAAVGVVFMVGMKYVKKIRGAA